MFPPYIALIQDLFPHAEIIMDRFHIVQAINREINRCRVQVMNGFRTKDRPQYNKLKRYWKLLLKAPLDLDRMIYQSYRLFKSWQSQYSLVQYLLGLDERLKETYETGHRLLSALKSNDIQQLQFILQYSKTKRYFTRPQARHSNIHQILALYLKYDALPTFNEWAN